MHISHKMPYIIIKYIGFTLVISTNYFLTINHKCSTYIYKHTYTHLQHFLYNIPLCEYMLLSFLRSLLTDAQIEYKFPLL